MTRWKAAAFHLTISACIATIIVLLMVLVWYPPPYFSVAGANGLIMLLVGVDLCVGPLLTLIVFRSGKRGLKFDLTFIGCLQSVALIYGMHVMLLSRPVFLVAAVDRIAVVAADQVSDADLAMGHEARFRSRSWTGPVLVGLQLPTDPKKRSDLMFAALAGHDAQTMPKYYRDYATTAHDLLKRAKTLAELRKLRPGSTQLITNWLEDSGRSAASVVWVPLQGRKASMVMLLDANTADPLHALPIDPWSK